MVGDSGPPTSIWALAQLEKCGSQIKQVNGMGIPSGIGEVL